MLARDDAVAAPRRHALLAGAIVLHAVGLGVKPVAATLPAAWLLHALFVPVSAEIGDPAWRRAWRRIPAALPLFALSALSAARAIRATSGATTEGFAIPGLPVESYLATQLRVIPTYLRFLAWPAGQCGDRLFAPSRGFLEPGVLAGAAFLGAAVAVAVAIARRTGARRGDVPAAARTASLGVSFFLVALLPSSSIVPLRDTFAEHRVYLAALGVFLAASAGACAVLRQQRSARAAYAGVAVGVAVLAAAGFATARRNVAWSSALAFWTDAAEATPPKARALANLGLALGEAGRPAEALAMFRRARELRDDGSVSDRKLLQNTVAVLTMLGRPDEAREEIAWVLQRFPREAEALAQLARIELVASRAEQAEQAALASLAIDSRNVTALQVLATARLLRDDVAGARAALRAAAATNVVNPKVYSALGEVEERAGDAGAACAAFARAAAQPLNRWESVRARQALARLRCR